MKLYLKNFGCKVNGIETEETAALMQKSGWQITDSPEEADAILLNSCTVTASGDSRMLHTLKKLRKNCPDAAIVLTGCYVQAFPEQAAALLEADILTGTGNRSRIPVLLEEFMQTRKRISDIRPHTVFEELPTGRGDGHTRAFLKIQDGCSRFCSYCIIPYARGKSRSRMPESVEQAAGFLKKQGFQEIVLCGINLACWGQESGLTIADAVRICSDAGFRRVRLGSLEPEGLGEAVLKQLSGNAAFCPQFHISLQSGCDRTLRAMHRRYTCAEYARLTEQIRSFFPDAGLTTDIMTGFPGETEADFAETLAFAERIAFSRIHIFRYSRRPGTLADRMEGQISESVKKARADRLSQLEKRMHREFLQSRIGKTAEVLFEREKQPEFHTGHAPDYCTVLIPAAPGEKSFRNHILPVKITSIRGDCLLGEIPCSQVYVHK